MKTWREVELRREYLRGWRDGMIQGENDTMVIAYSTELVSLEALKPCERCHASGLNYGYLEDETPFHCRFCDGSGIEGGTP
jgi:hypothetical protein